MIEQLHFDHVGLSVADLERSHRFYAAGFWFDHVEDEFVMPQREIRGRVLVNGAGARIELFERRGSVPFRRGSPTEDTLQQGWFQVAFATPDVQATFERVVAAGARPLMQPRLAPDGRARVAFVADPDGNLVELLQRPELT